METSSCTTPAYSTEKSGFPHSSTPESQQAAPSIRAVKALINELLQSNLGNIGFPVSVCPSQSQLPCALTPLERATQQHATQSVKTILPDSSVTDVPAERVPGTVLWVDYEAARKFGFSVSPENRMTEELHAQLIEKFSLKTIFPLEPPLEPPLPTPPLQNTFQLTPPSIQITNQKEMGAQFMWIRFALKGQGLPNWHSTVPSHPTKTPAPAHCVKPL
ncbi:MAG: hypothetical protein HC848_00765 [Limnobacter sp.]|nr:hypothetical protein [Limnobacter sp.]